MRSIHRTPMIPDPKPNSDAEAALVLFAISAVSLAAGLFCVARQIL